MSDYSNATTTMNTPTLAELQSLIEKMKAAMLEDRTLVLMDDVSHAVVTANELRNWREGRRLPPFLKNFNRWWLAMLVWKRLPVNLYSIDSRAFEPTFPPVRFLDPAPPMPLVRYMTA